MLQALIDGQTDPERLALVHRPRVKASRAEAARGAARARDRAPPLHAQAAPGPDRRARPSHRRHREGGGPRARTVSTSGQVAEHHARPQRGQRQRRRRRDRHRHVALRHARPSAVLGLFVPAQRRERGQAPQQAAAPRLSASWRAAPPAAHETLLRDELRLSARWGRSKNVRFRRLCLAKTRAAACSAPTAAPARPCGPSPAHRRASVDRQESTADSCLPHERAGLASPALARAAAKRLRGARPRLCSPARRKADVHRTSTTGRQPTCG